jgi:Na+-driven multidrug efflux pump
MSLYFGVSLFTAVYTIVLNGTGKVKMQSIVSIITAVLHIPVVLFFIRYLHLGLNSLVYASLLWTIVQVIVWRNEIRVVLRLEHKQRSPEILTSDEVQIANT